MKLLIYGHKGWIGTQFLKILEKEEVRVIKGDARVENPITLEQELDKEKPTHVISFIGRTHGQSRGTRLSNNRLSRTTRKII